MLSGTRLPFRYLLGDIKGPLLNTFLLGLFCEMIPEFVGHEHMPDIPAIVASSLAIAVSVLLSFKVGQSYDRWWEARKIWGSIVNDSRTLVLQLQQFLGPKDPAIESFALRQSAWCYALAHALRQQAPPPQLAELLSEAELRALEEEQHVPLKLLEMHTSSLRELQSSRLNAYAYVELSKTLQRLTASMGKCERIKNTVFPPTYRLGMHFAIYLFTALFSLAALRLSTVVEVPLLLLLSGTFFFLDQVANWLQDPFENQPADTPMLALSRTIEKNLRQLLGKPVSTASAEPDADFYIL